MALGEQEQLLRKKTTRNSSFFDWLLCCSNANLPRLDMPAYRKPIPISKRPLKQRMATRENVPDSESKQNSLQLQNGNKTERQNQQSKTVQPRKLSLHQTEYNQMLRKTVASQQASKSWKIHFSYAQTKICHSFVNPQTQKEKLKQISRITTTQTFKNPPPLNLRENSSEMISQPKQCPKYLLKNTSCSVDEEDYPSPKTLSYKQSTQSVEGKSVHGRTRKVNKAKSKGGQYSLIMRQVESIREPEGDSENESIVVEGQDNRLFGLLLQIRQIDRESHIDGLRDDQ